MTLTPIQELLVKEAFQYIVDDVDEDASLPSSFEIDGYKLEECSTNTLKALQRRGFVKDFNKNELSFSVIWDAVKVYDWVTL